MNGQLSEQPFAELIREIAAKRMSGRLRVQQNRIAVVSYFKDGVFLYAAANVRTLRLREYLTKINAVGESELQQLGDIRSDLQLASMLVEKNLLEAKKAEDIQLKQVADVLRLALLWTEGTWEFDYRSHLNEQLDFNLDPVPLLMEAGRRMPPNFLASRFRNDTEVLSLNQMTINAKGLDRKETFIITQLDRQRPLNELVAVSGFSSEDTLRAIYALALSDVIVRENWKAAFREVALPPVELAKPAAPVAEIKEEAQADDRSEDSDLQNFLDRVEAASTHYEVLEIGRAASVDEVKRRYYDFARRYHPDRFRRTEDVTLHGRIEAAFALVTRAYETLRDAGSRATYDSKLAAGPSASGRMGSPQKTGGPKQESVSTRERAEFHFRDGLAALKAGENTVAINNFASAAQVFPDDARYRAFYGHALSANEKSRRLAEVELQAALKLEPDNPDYRTMLAQLYKALGFPRRARAEAERALAAAPNHGGARDLLKDLPEA